MSALIRTQLCPRYGASGLYSAGRVIGHAQRPGKLEARGEGGSRCCLRSSLPQCTDPQLTLLPFPLFVRLFPISTVTILRPKCMKVVKFRHELKFLKLFSSTEEICSNFYRALLSPGEECNSYLRLHKHLVRLNYIRK